MALTVTAALLGGTRVASAQGAIAGRVLDRATQRPVPDAQIVIVGTTRGTRTGDDGAFRLQNVEPGAYTLRAIRIGYAAQVRTTRVTTNETAVVSFDLDATPTVIDQVTVTATGESQRRRENGTSTGLISAGDLTIAASPTISDVLSSRTAGVVVQSAGGTTGTSSRVRIRGSNSINLSNDPLLIVDGVRVNNNSSSFSIGVGGQTISRLDDFNPDDIENVEIIKGPAASALYGTAAANGVIQVTTKKGHAGPTRWGTFTEYGTLKDPTTYPANFTQIGLSPTGVRLTNRAQCTLDVQVQGLCRPFADSLASFNPLESVSPHRVGWRQSSGLNAAGGNERVTYYLGGELEREQGVYDPNTLRKISLRTNLRSELTPAIDATISAGYTSSQLRLPYNDNLFAGALSAGLLGKAFDCSPSTFKQIPACAAIKDSLSRGYVQTNVPIQDYFVVENRQNVERFVGSINSNWQLAPWLRAVGTSGIDFANRYDGGFTPPNKIPANQSTLEGSRYQARVAIPTYSANGTLTASYGLPYAIQATTSAGTQYIREESHLTSAFGAVVLPGTSSLNGTSARFSIGEENSEVVTIGFYARQQLSINDRFFLTGGLRGDQGSTFGTKFGYAKYPSVSASWVISEEGFFPRTRFLNQLRLRAAYGQSGQRPSFRDADTYFSPVSVLVAGAEVPAITVGGTGNASLKPELSTEREAGFEASLLDDRLGLEFTGYHKTTKDALVRQVLAPSLGVTASQLANLGEVRNTGLEMLAKAKLVQRDDFGLETTITASTSHNTVINLGAGVTPILFGFGSSQQHRNGFPLGAYFQRRIVSYSDLNGDGIISRINCPSYGGVANPQVAGGPKCEVVLSDSVEFAGTPLPTREATFNTSVTLFKYLRLTSLFDYRGGQKLYNFTREFRCTTSLTVCQDAYDKRTPLKNQAAVAARLMGSGAGYIEDASFVKLRELAITLTLPSRMGTAKTQGLSVTFAGRNLRTWTDYSGFDPEVNSNAAFNFTTADFLAQPPVRYFTARVNYNF
ncbi:MAG: SusC/RagA family TonB-linked outer membrane protein [Gemmatimonadaceae bacterium]